MSTEPTPSPGPGAPDRGEAPRRSVLLRVLSGVAGTVVLLGSALFTFGTSLAAPLGIFLGGRLARRRGRPFTRLYSWASAAAASAVVVLLALVVIIVLLPPGSLREIQESAASSEAQHASQPPEWLTRAFPRAARPGPVTDQVVNSRVFAAYTGIVGFVLAAGLLGTIAGSAGWLGTMLLTYSIRGVRPA